MQMALDFIDFPFHRRNKSFIRRHRSIFSDGDGGRLREAVPGAVPGRWSAPGWARGAAAGSVDTQLGGREGSHEELGVVEIESWDNIGKSRVVNLNLNSLVTWDILNQPLLAHHHHYCSDSERSWFKKAAWQSCVRGWEEWSDNGLGEVPVEEG